jgi:hypothetical protein
MKQRRAPQLWAGAMVLACVAALAPTEAAARRFRPSMIFEDARGLLNGYSATAGVFMMGGQSDVSGWRAGHVATPTGMGFRYFERNGLITGTTVGILRMLSAAVVASGPKSVRTYEDSQYRYTETTYYSQAEKDAITRAASNSAARMFASPHQSFDLEIYARSLGGDASGYRTNWMLGGVDFARGRGLVDFGFGFGSVRSAAAAENQYLITNWDYLGVPIRASYAVGPVLLSGQWDWNWYGHSRGGESKGTRVKPTLVELSTAGFPLRIGAATALLGRIYVEAVAMTPSVTSGAFGFTATAGARF